MWFQITAGLISFVNICEFVWKQAVWTPCMNICFTTYVLRNVVILPVVEGGIFIISTELLKIWGRDTIKRVCTDCSVYSFDLRTVVFLSCPLYPFSTCRTIPWVEPKNSNLIYWLNGYFREKKISLYYFYLWNGKNSEIHCFFHVIITHPQSLSYNRGYISIHKSSVSIQLGLNALNIRRWSSVLDQLLVE